MSRRNYLQRIAEPIQPGEPVLFAVPHPARNSARPAANRPADIIRRAPAFARAAGPAAAVSQQTPAASTPSLPVLPPVAAPAAAAAEIAPVRMAADEPASERPSPAVEALPPASPSFVPPTAPPVAAEPLAATARVSEPPIAEVAVATAEHPDRQVAREPERASSSARPVRLPADLPNRSVEAAGRPPAQVSAPPRIYIGTVEVRVIAPQPAPTPVVAQPSAPSAAAPAPRELISRGYGWRLGVGQG